MEVISSSKFAKYRLKTIFNSDQIERKHENEKEVLIKQKDAEKNIIQLFNALDAFNALAEAIQNVFGDAGINIDEEQIIYIIQDLRNISKGCETYDEFVQRIQDLKVTNCF